MEGKAASARAGHRSGGLHKTTSGLLLHTPGRQERAGEGRRAHDLAVDSSYVSNSGGPEAFLLSGSSPQGRRKAERHSPFLTPSQTPDVIPCHIVRLHLQTGNSPAWPRTVSIHPSDRSRSQKSTSIDLEQAQPRPRIPNIAPQHANTKQVHSFLIPVLGPSLLSSQSLCDIDGHEMSLISAVSVNSVGPLITVVHRHHNLL